MKISDSDLFENKFVINNELEKNIQKLRLEINFLVIKIKRHKINENTLKCKPSGLVSNFF